MRILLQEQNWRTYVSKLHHLEKATKKQRLVKKPTSWKTAKGALHPQSFEFCLAAPKNGNLNGTAAPAEPATPADSRRPSWASTASLPLSQCESVPGWRDQNQVVDNPFLGRRDSELSTGGKRRQATIKAAEARAEAIGALTQQFALSTARSKGSRVPSPSPSHHSARPQSAQLRPDTGKSDARSAHTARSRPQSAMSARSRNTAAAAAQTATPGRTEPLEATMSVRPATAASRPRTAASSRPRTAASVRQNGAAPVAGGSRAGDAASARPGTAASRRSGRPLSRESGRVVSVAAMRLRIS